MGIVWVASFGAFFVVMHPNSVKSGNSWINALSFIAAGCAAIPGVIHLGFM